MLQSERLKIRPQAFLVEIHTQSSSIFLALSCHSFSHVRYTNFFLCIMLKMRTTSWLGLHEEMKLDMQRIWKRNLGRDDRCISDHGKEVLKDLDYIKFCARISSTSLNVSKSTFLISLSCFHQARFPFLDEDVIRTLLDIPLWEIADLDRPSGVGDKKILREVCTADITFYNMVVMPFIIMVMHLYSPCTTAGCTITWSR